MLPVPISTPGFDNGPYTTSSHFVSRDPETGQYNMGNYRGQIKATDRMGCFAGNFSGLRAHWNKCRALKKPLEVACVIGVPPNLSYAAVARIAPGLNEYGVAGGISGAAGRDFGILHILTASSFAPLAIVRPSGAKATAQTSPKWP